MARRASVTPRRPLERDVQRQVMHLFALAGCVTYSTSQGFRREPGGTRMTPGLADLLVFLPLGAKLSIRAPEAISGYGLIERPIGFFEVKTPEGLKLHHRNLAKREKRAVAQDRFGTLCRERGIPYAIGGVEQAWAFLASVGLARWMPVGEGKTGTWTLTPRRP